MTLPSECACSVVVSIVDTVSFYAIKKDPTKLTLPFFILMVVVTIIPIGVNLWYWLIFKLHIS